MTPRPYRSSRLLWVAVAGVLLAGYSRIEARTAQDRTVYDDWIAENRAKQDADRRAKSWEDKAGRSGYTDYSSDLAALNEQSRIRSMWKADEEREAAHRAARAVIRAEDKARAERLALEAKADSGDANALMTVAAGEESSESSGWGIPKYVKVRGPRRMEALRRVAALTRTHPDWRSRCHGDFRLREGYLRELSDGGDVPASKELAASGLRDEMFADAARYFARAAEGGDEAAALALISLRAEDLVEDTPVDPELFNRWCEAAANKTGIEAGYVLGRAMCLGEGAEKNPVKALALLRRAATAPDGGIASKKAIRANAARLAGLMLRDGAGVPANSSEAVALLENAAAAGNIRAMCELGETYLAGIGLPADLPLARSWLTRAADLEDAHATFLLATLCLRPDAERAEQGEGLLRLRRCAKRDPEAMIRYGIILYEGRHGVERNRAESLEYFNLAFRHYPNDVRVLDFVGASYLTGDFGIMEKPEKAVRLLTLAYQRGNLRSAARLAEAYRTGRGLPADPAQAGIWESRLR